MRSRAARLSTAGRGRRRWRRAVFRASGIVGEGSEPALQKALDDSVAAGRVPFVIGMTGKASGVTFAGASGDAAPGMKAAPDTV